MHFSTGLLLTTVLSSVSLSFFIVGAASVDKGWFRATNFQNASLKAWFGTVKCCLDQDRTFNSKYCYEYTDTHFSSDLLHGGRLALVFAILAVVLNLVASLFTGVIGRFTARRFPHLRSRQDCIASVCALIALCCGLIAVCVFYGLMRRASQGTPYPDVRPDYAWVLVLVGSVIDVLLAGATCIHVIIPDTESPWHERPGSEAEKLVGTQERLMREPIEVDDDTDDDVLEPTWAQRNGGGSLNSSFDSTSTASSSAPSSRKDDASLL